MSHGLELNNDERTRCEIYTRVMGYHRPVTAWNKGKQQEHRDRRQFREEAVTIHPYQIGIQSSA